MKTFAGTFIAALLVATFTANGATISRDDHSPFYSPGLVQYVAANGDFPVVIIANPFGAGSNATLLAVVELPGNFLPTALSSITAKARNDGHLVMIFNPRPSSSGDRACRSPFVTMTRWSARPTWSCPGPAAPATRPLAWPWRSYSPSCCPWKVQAGAIAANPQAIARATSVLSNADKLL